MVAVVESLAADRELKQASTLLSQPAFYANKIAGLASL